MGMWVKGVDMWDDWNICPQLADRLPSVHPGYAFDGCHSLALRPGTKA